MSGRNQEKLVSFISTVAVSGLAIATAIMILVLSVMNGFEREFRDRILGVAPHARIFLNLPEYVSSSDKNAYNDIFISMQKSINESKGIRNAIPFVELQALAVKGVMTEPLLIQGLPLNDLKTIAGEFLIDKHERPLTISELGANDIIVGGAIAKKHHLSIHENLRLVILDQQKNNNTKNNNTKNNTLYSAKQSAAIHTFNVVGFFNTGTELDNRLAIINLNKASSLKYNASLIDGFQIQVEDIFSVNQLVRNAAYNAEVSGNMTDWKQSFGNLYSAIQLSRQMVVLLLTSIIAIAVFNVFVTLGMVVRYKRSNIAILRSMGMRSRQLMMIFTLQGLYIALVGCCIGVILGIVLTLFIPHAIEFYQHYSNQTLLNTDIYPINYLPTEIKLNDIILIIGSAFILCLLATLSPSRQAVKLSPAKILNHHI